MPCCGHLSFEISLEILSRLPVTCQRNSEILNDTPLQPPESHYLLSSPGEPVSADGFVRISLHDIQRTLVYRSLRTLPGHSIYPAEGGSFTLRDRGNSDTTDKLGCWQDCELNRRKTARERPTPTAHEYCSNGGDFASGSVSFCTFRLFRLVTLLILTQNLPTAR